MSQNLFCYNAWTYAQVLTTGQLTYCCFAKNSALLQEDESSISVQSSPDLQKMLNSKKQKSARVQLLNGKFPKDCSLCKEAEKVGGHSPRLALEAGLSAYIDKDLLMAETQSDGTVQNPKLSYLELRLGNHCNLRCRFCGPHSSSSWYRDFEKLYGTDQFTEGSQSIGTTDNLFFEWPSSEKFMNWFQNISESLLTLQFAGGEPFLSPVHKNILKFLLESGISKNLNLIYITNGTVVNSDFIEIWKKFRSVKIFVSIEGLNTVYEYQRWPAKWKNVEKNIQAFENFVGNGVSQVLIQPMINVYNVATISELAIWFLRKPARVSWVRHVSFLTEPRWQSAYILTPAQKAEVIAKINTDLIFIENNFTSSERRTLIMDWLQSVCGILLEHDWTEHYAEFKTNNLKLDQIRKGLAQDFLDPLTVSFL